MHPLISVVIPSYNQGGFIEETILSVLGQNYPRMEVLVIDGGSTDDTVDIIKKHSARLGYWHSRKDSGQADAINQGMRLAKGDILCWLNSDDMYLPLALRKAARQLAGRVGEPALVYGAALVMREGKTPFGAAKVPEGFVADRLTYFDYIVQPSSFWTRALWEAAGELNAEYNYVLDWDWFIRASRVARFEYEPGFLSIYRLHDQHKTGKGGDRRREEILEVVRTYSSPYWVDIYEEVFRLRQRIRRWWQTFNRFRLRGFQYALPVLCPSLGRRLRRIGDLRYAMTMLDLWAQVEVA